MKVLEEEECLNASLAEKGMWLKAGTVTDGVEANLGNWGSSYNGIVAVTAESTVSETAVAESAESVSAESTTVSAISTTESSVASSVAVAVVDGGGVAAADVASGETAGVSHVGEGQEDEGTDLQRRETLSFVLGCTSLRIWLNTLNNRKQSALPSFPVPLSLALPMLSM